MSSNTAIIVFSRRATEEAKHKKFGPGGYRANVKAAHSLIRQVVTVASQTTAKVFSIDDTQQVGDTFGEKLSNGFKFVFDQGFENVIAIGNDCPELTSSILEKTIGMLQKNEVVLGPSKDGGLFLIGLSRSAFNKAAFESLPWQTDQLLKSYIQLCNETFKKLGLLRTLFDVNNYQDVLHFIRIGLQPLFKILFASNDLVQDDIESQEPPRYFDTPYLKVDFLRGPPVAA